MAGTLPNIAPPCCDPCESPVTVAVPGPAGATGATGAAGAAGKNAYTTFSAAFTMPAELASAAATVADTSWIVIDQILFAAKSDGTVIGYLQATAIGGPTTVTLKNLEDTPNGAYTVNSAPASVFPIGAKLSPAGLQGPAGTVAGTAVGGDLKGTLVNPRISVANTKGSIPVGDGTNTTAFPVGTNGHLLSPDSTAGNGLKYFKGVPVTGDANVAQNRVPRLSAATGLPIPLEASRMSIKDPGGAGTLVADADAGVGNARGADAIDLQTSRNAVTQVASGQESVISGGRRNTASGTRSTIGGGDTNSNAGQEGFIGAGNANSISAGGVQGVIGGGDTNTVTAEEATVGGGGDNGATAANATVAGGNTNTGSGVASAVGGGEANTASGDHATIAGGFLNSATVPYSHVPGGRDAIAYNYGQKAHASGRFAAQGDAQACEYVWRLTTLNAAPNKPMFLDGAAFLAVMPVSRTWAFSILVVARTAANVGAAWKIEGAIQNSAANAVTLVSAVTTTLIADGTGATWGVAGNVVVEADNVNKCLNIRVAATVDPATTVRWVATGRIAEVGH